VFGPIQPLYGFVGPPPPGWGVLGGVVGQRRTPSSLERPDSSRIPPHPTLSRRERERPQPRPLPLEALDSPKDGLQFTLSPRGRTGVRGNGAPQSSLELPDSSHIPPHPTLSRRERERPQPRPLPPEALNSPRDGLQFTVSSRGRAGVRGNVAPQARWSFQTPAAFPLTLPSPPGRGNSFRQVGISSRRSRLNEAL